MWYYNGYWGMNFIWWIIWILFLIWIFATPWGFRRTRDTSYDILRKRFASGEITKEEYQEKKAILEKDFNKHNYTT
ncbi:MAG: SHOCT domain-containing protein [Ginsengibacter sp.]